MQVPFPKKSAQNLRYERLRLSFALIAPVSTQFSPFSSFTSKCKAVLNGALDCTSYVEEITGAILTLMEHCHELSANQSKSLLEGSGWSLRQLVFRFFVAIKYFLQHQGNVFFLFTCEHLDEPPLLPVPMAATS